MHQHTSARAAVLCAAAACIFFCLAGLAFLPYLGVQNDEALFAQALYEPRAGLSALRIGHSTFPLMLMSYLGTLKAYLWKPVFRAFGTDVMALRVPALLAAAGSVWLFFLALRRVVGARAAVIGCVLLAADTLYLLTACFDWGPVALQHLLLAGGMLLLVRFYQQGGAANLAFGFFLFGLAMWDKALAVWMLSGMGIAGLVTFPRAVWRLVTPRRIGLVVLAFLVGALPLIVFNAGHHWSTFHGNFRLDLTDVAPKARLLALTAAGPGLFGWLVNEDWQAPTPHGPRTAIEAASFRVSSLAARPRHNLMVYAFALALLLAPLARGTALRAILFALIALVVAWLQMAVNANTGGSVHHTILVWPLPVMAIAVSLDAASRRLGRAGLWAVAAVTVVLAVSGALVTNEYFTLMVRNGGPQNWTDAVFALSRYSARLPARFMFVMDWGILDSLRLLNRGALPLQSGIDQIGKPDMPPEDHEILLRMISDPDNVYIAHTKAFEFFPHNGTFLAYAERLGYHREIMATIPDSFGRPVYEVYRLVTAAPQMAAASARAVSRP